jgi:hypothetical protein
MSNTYSVWTALREWALYNTVAGVVLCGAVLGLCVAVREERVGGKGDGGRGYSKKLVT